MSIRQTPIRRPQIAREQVSENFDNGATKRRVGAVASESCKDSFARRGANQMLNGTTCTPNNTRCNVMKISATTIPATTAMTSVRATGSKLFTA